jgi:hypothetical protein
VGRADVIARRPFVRGAHRLCVLSCQCRQSVAEADGQLILGGKVVEQPTLRYLRASRDGFEGRVSLALGDQEIRVRVEYAIPR